MPPAVSVLMPTLDVRPYIEESMASVFEQTLQDFEILVVDGGSNDGTLEFVESIEDERVRVFRNCGGIVPSLQEGVRNAWGRYIARVDADTVSLPERFERQVGFLDTNPDCGVVGSHARRIDADTGERGMDTRPLTHEGITAMLLRRNPMVHPTMMIRREALAAVGNYRDYRFEDYELVTRLAGRYRLANLDAVLVESYVREDSIMQTIPRVERVLASTICGLHAVRNLDYPLQRRLWLYARRIGIGIGVLAHAYGREAAERLSASRRG